MRSSELKLEPAPVRSVGLAIGAVFGVFCSFGALGAGPSETDELALVAGPALLAAVAPAAFEDAVLFAALSVASSALRLQCSSARLRSRLFLLLFCDSCGFASTHSRISSVARAEASRLLKPRLAQRFLNCRKRSAPLVPSETPCSWCYKVPSSSDSSSAASLGMRDGMQLNTRQSLYPLALEPKYNGGAQGRGNGGAVSRHISASWWGSSPTPTPSSPAPPHPR